MNNFLENDLFGFPKEKWLRLTDEVGTPVRHHCQILSGFNMAKIIKVGKMLTGLFKKISRWANTI